MGVIRGKRESMLQRQRDEEKLMGAHTLHSGGLAAENGGRKEGKNQFSTLQNNINGRRGKTG